jgi:hypothetical protein
MIHFCIFASRIVSPIGIVLAAYAAWIPVPLSFSPPLRYGLCRLYTPPYAQLQARMRTQRSRSARLAYTWLARDLQLDPMLLRAGTCTPGDDRGSRLPRLARITPHSRLT